MLELDDERPLQQREVEAIASAIEARRLSAPAVLCLEMMKPLVRVGQAAAIVSAPLLGPLVGPSRLQLALRLLHSPGAVDILISRLEGGAEK